MELTRAAAWALLTEYTASESLLKHALAVEAAVAGYARLFGEDNRVVGCGLASRLRLRPLAIAGGASLQGGGGSRPGLGYPEWVTRAILSHADYTGVSRESRLERTLFACDEMAGFITAASLIRPSRSILDLEPASVVKRMKDKAFARAVSRDDLRAGADLLGLPLDQHIANVIGFMRERAEALGLRGNL